MNVDHIETAPLSSSLLRAWNRSLHALSTIEPASDRRGRAIELACPSRDSRDDPASPRSKLSLSRGKSLRQAARGALYILSHDVAPAALPAYADSQTSPRIKSVMSFFPHAGNVTFLHSHACMPVYSFSGVDQASLTFTRRAEAKSRFSLGDLFRSAHQAYYLLAQVQVAAQQLRQLGVKTPRPGSLSLR